MKLFSGLRRWVNTHRKPKQFEQGMTLQPGESAEVELPVELSIFLEQARLDGKVISSHPIATMELDGNYEQLVMITIDGEPAASLSMRGKGSPPTLDLRREQR